MYNIYLDMDGVLAAYDKGYAARKGNREFTTEGHRDFVKHAGFLHLEPTKEFEDIKEIVMQYNNINFEILGSLGFPKDEDIEYCYMAADQKESWLYNNGLGHLKNNFVAHKGMKKYFATPSSFLLDDTVQNIWDFNECRGTGILFKHDNDWKEELLDVCKFITNSTHKSIIWKQ